MGQKERYSELQSVQETGLSYIDAKMKKRAFSKNEVQ